MGHRVGRATGRAAGSRPSGPRRSPVMLPDAERGWHPDGFRRAAPGPGRRAVGNPRSALERTSSALRRRPRPGPAGAGSWGSCPSGRRPRPVGAAGRCPFGSPCGGRGLVTLRACTRSGIRNTATPGRHRGRSARRSGRPGAVGARGRSRSLRSARPPWRRRSGPAPRWPGTGTSPAGLLEQPADADAHRLAGRTSTHSAASRQSTLIASAAKPSGRWVIGSKHGARRAAAARARRPPRRECRTGRTSPSRDASGAARVQPVQLPAVSDWLVQSSRRRSSQGTASCSSPARPAAIRRRAPTRSARGARAGTGGSPANATRRRHRRDQASTRVRG